MKQFVILTCLAGVAGWLCTGCDDRPPSPAARKQTTNVVRIAKSTPAKTAKPKKEILPGTIDHLDASNGFRDLTFGQPDTNIPDLVETSRDEARQLRTCTRSGEIMSLHGVPLERVDYRFYRGELYAIQLNWKIAHADSALSQPPTTDISVYCAQEYGAPRVRRVTKDGAQYIWRGRRVEIVLTESLLPGVANLTKGGWAIPPTTTGRMAIRNLALSRAAEARLADKPAQDTNGL
jgi:hypothetical protein